MACMFMLLWVLQNMPLREVDFLDYFQKDRSVTASAKLTALKGLGFRDNSASRA